MDLRKDTVTPGLGDCLKGAHRRWYLLSQLDGEGDEEERKGGAGQGIFLWGQGLQLSSHALDLTFIRKDGHSVFL